MRSSRRLYRVRLRAVVIASTLLAAGATATIAAEPGAAAPFPFEPSAEIERLGQQVARRHALAQDRLDAILDLIFSEREGPGFEYRRRPSLTAAEALERRSGNCISLVNLFVALARSAGLSAGFVEVLDFEAFYREEATIVRSTHVIGGVEVAGQLATVDFFPGRAKTYRRTRPISDRRAAAHFYNSVAVEAMLAGEPERAESLFLQALTIDPGHAETWNNRAVLRLRGGDLEEAVVFLERSLEIDPAQLSATENLVPLYRRLGRTRLAQKTEERAFELRTKNPFFLLRKALERTDAGDLAEARKLLQRARRIDGSIPEIHLALGRVELLRGHPRKAEAHFERAQARSVAYSQSFQARIQSKIDRLLSEQETGAADSSAAG